MWWSSACLLWCCPRTGPCGVATFGRDRHEYSHFPGFLAEIHNHRLDTEGMSIHVIRPQPIRIIRVANLGRADFPALGTGVCVFTTDSKQVARTSLEVQHELQAMNPSSGDPLDLRDTTLALAADRAAARAAAATGQGVLVSLGLDIAVAGPPPAGGWKITVANRPGPGPEPAVRLETGGMAIATCHAAPAVR